jgi:CxxC motif-containing protein
MHIEGYKCDKGFEYAEKEAADPHRVLTTTVRTKFPDVSMISVKTDGEIPKFRIPKAMLELAEVVVDSELAVGDVIVEDIAETGVSVVITSPVLMKLGAELENKNIEIEKLGAVNAAAVAVASAPAKGGIGIVKQVRNNLPVDKLRAEAADGFVGAAGEAVGVEEVIDEDTNEVDLLDGYTQEEVKLKSKDRSHIHIRKR